MFGEDQGEGVIDTSMISPYLARNKNGRRPSWSYDSDRENYRKGSEIVLGSPRGEIGRGDSLNKSSIPARNGSDRLIIPSYSMTVNIFLL